MGKCTCCITLSLALVASACHATEDPHIPFQSQKGQDHWIIQEVFPNLQEGFFIDLAAFDGIDGNNTYALEKSFNWKGICIEPNPEAVRELRYNRRATIDTSCIDFEPHKVDFRFDNGWLGGIVDSDTGNNPSVRAEEIRQAYISRSIQRISTTTLDTVLKRHNAPKVIQYLSLDVEGAEERVLRNFPFDEYTFLAITVERPCPKLHNLLIYNDYKLVKCRVFCCFYIHKSHPKSAEFREVKYTPIPRKTW